MSIFLHFFIVQSRSIINLVSQTWRWYIAALGRRQKLVNVIGSWKKDGQLIIEEHLFLLISSETSGWMESLFFSHTFVLKNHKEVKDLEDQNHSDGGLSSYEK